MSSPEFEVAFARSDADLRAVQSLRYDVFVRELGAQVAAKDHAEALERDHFDRFSRHLMLRDRTRGSDISEQIVGVYRLLDRKGAAQAGGFYSENEFDLTPLTSSPHSLLELGRSCLHVDYRGGMAMYHLWSALAAYVLEQRIDILFGVASFQGTDQAELRAPLSVLEQCYLAPPHLRPVARTPYPDKGASIDVIAERKRAMTQMPALIKAYLRLGGCVGQGAYLDHDFNTTDVCLVLDVTQMSDTQRKIYTRKL